MILQDFSDVIAKAVEGKFGLKVDFELVYADSQFGDFATNVAFVLAKQLHRPPHQIATELATAIKDTDVESATAAGAGFINIAMKPKFWLEQLGKIDNEYGKNDSGQGQKVQVEFISANPTGPMTLGNARGGFLGDVICRVLGYNGYEVTREYYFNDAGTQIQKLVNSIKLKAGIDTGEEPQYSGSYVQELADELKDIITDMNDEEIAEFATKTIKERYIDVAIAKMGISFDVWFNEKTLVASGEFDEAVKRLKKMDFVYEKDGALWLASEKYGDERDRVLKKSNGDVTYLGNDIAYHINTYEKQGFDGAIKVWGADHAGQVPSLRLTMQQLVPEKRLDFVILQLVRLMRSGQEVKMSKRAGTYVTVEELIDEVGADVARFFFLMRSADSQMDFDLDLAKEHSQKNPLFYLMYSYARANSILKQATEKGLAPAAKTETLSRSETALVKQMTKFPALTREIAVDYSVHKLTFFGLELSKLFHEYYEKERILGLPKAQAEQKLYFVKRYMDFMKNYAEVLGITLQDKM